MAAAQDTVQALELLTHLDTVNMNQVTSTYRGNKFTVFSGEDVLFNLVEENHDFSMFSYGRRRGFHMCGVDSTGKRVFSFFRPGTSMSDKIELSMNDALVSVVRLKATFLTPVIRIHDAQDNLVLRVKGKFADYVNFELQTKVKKPIGSIYKKPHRSMKEIRSRLDDYVINFPADLDVKLKVAVIVACVLVVSIYPGLFASALFTSSAYDLIMIHL